MKSGGWIGAAVLVCVAGCRASACGFARISEVHGITSMCCEDLGDDDCSTGFPTTCASKCADVLVPFWEECGTFIQGLSSGSFNFDIPSFGTFAGVCRNARIVADAHGDGDTALKVEHRLRTVAFADATSMSPNDLFEMYDGDGDGQLGIEEFARNHSIGQELQSLFERVDSDRSGSVTADEFADWLRTRNNSICHGAHTGVYDCYCPNGRCSTDSCCTEFCGGCECDHSCDAGTSCSGHNDAKCGTRQKPCPAGKYNDRVGTLTGCINCERGKFQPNAKGTSCIECGQGQFQGDPGQLHCVRCPVGTYGTPCDKDAGCNLTLGLRLSESEACTSCGAGFYQDKLGSKTCLACLAGRFSNANDKASFAACKACDRGTYENRTGAAKCTLCPAGKYQNHTGASELNACKECPSGHGRTSPGSFDCSDCGAGQYRDPASSKCMQCVIGKATPTGAEPCKTCGPGTFAIHKGQANCDLCAKGKHSHVTTEPCVPCEPGRFQDTTGQPSCISCPAGQFLPEGAHASSASSCRLCALGRYTSNRSAPTTCDMQMSMGHPSADCTHTNGTWMCSCRRRLPDPQWMRDGDNRPMLPKWSRSEEWRTAATPCEEMTLASTVCARYGNDCPCYKQHSRCYNCTLCSGPTAQCNPTSTVGCATGCFTPVSGGCKCTDIEDNVTNVYDQEDSRLVERTQSWLNLARNYYLQGSSENAEVVAEQLCSEWEGNSSFRNWPCLHLDLVEHDLHQIYSDACHLARLAGNDNKVSVHEVPSRGFEFYTTQFKDFSLDLEFIKGNGNLRDQIQRLRQEQESADKKGSTDNARWAQSQEDEHRKSAQEFARQIKAYQSKVTKIQLKLKLDYKAFSDALMKDVTDQANRMAEDADKDLKAKHTAEVDQEMKTAVELGAAIAAIPLTGGASVAGEAAVAGGAAAEAGAAVAVAKTAQAAMKCCLKTTAKFLNDAVKVYTNKVEAGCKTAQCQRDQQSMQEVKQQMGALESFAGEFEAYTQLAKSIVITSDATDVTMKLPKVPMNIAGILDRLNERKSVVQKLKSVSDGGKSATGYETDVKDLLSALTAMFRAIGSYYEAMQKMQTAAFHRSMFANQTEQISKLEADEAALYAAQQRYFDDKMRDKCHTALQILKQQVHTYEMLQLKDFTPLGDLLYGPHGLKEQKLTWNASSTDGLGFCDRVTSVHDLLIQQWNDDIARDNNCGNTIPDQALWMEFSELQRHDFAQTGKVLVSIDVPNAPSNSHVTFSDMRAFFTGLRPRVDSEKPAELLITKLGVSHFVDERGEVWTFTHKPTTPIWREEYYVDNCAVGQTMVPFKAGTCVFGDGGGYMKLSPYGVWNVTLLNPRDFNESRALESVTGIRFDFNLAGKTFERAQNEDDTMFDRAVQLVTNKPASETDPRNCDFTHVFEKATTNTACNAEQLCRYHPPIRSQISHVCKFTHIFSDSNDCQTEILMAAALVAVVIGACCCFYIRQRCRLKCPCRRKIKNELHSRLDDNLDADDAWDHAHTNQRQPRQSHQPRQSEQRRGSVYYSDDSSDASEEISDED